MPSAHHAQKEPVTIFQEEQTKVTRAASSDSDARCRNTSERQNSSLRDKIKTYPITHLTGTAKVAFALKCMHRKPLMVHHFPYSPINPFAETGNRRPRRCLQHQWHRPRKHPGKRLR